MRPESVANMVIPGIREGHNITEDLKEYFRRAHTVGICVKAPWWKRLVGIKYETVRLPDSYEELFDG